jgi:enoyl-CoA hydratase/carnithine racemase
LLFLPYLIRKLTSFKGDEYLHLPAIVDAAESSPAAATEAAKRIRKFISKENHQRAYAQYNAIMLTRILTDNPAERFTRNFDTKFVATTKELLREGRDMSVQQILRETLDYFETEKLAGNQSLSPLVEMWKKEKSKAGGKIYNNAPVSLNAHVGLPG